MYPPGPKSRLPAGLLFQFRRDPMAFLTSLAAYGPIARFTIGPQAVYFLNDPALVREALVLQHRSFEKGGALKRAKVMLGEGLLTAEGDAHLAQRKLVQPAFHKARIAAFGEVMVGYAEAMSARWQPGQTLDVWSEMMHLTLAIVGKTLFDADVEGEAPEIEEAINALLAVFNLITLPFTELLLKIPTPTNLRARAAMARLDKLIYKLIEDRRGSDKGDLLGMLLGADDRQVRDEAMTLFLAGHETTANALTWAWYLLGQNPDAEAALHAELDAVLGDRAPTFEDMPRLVVTERILSEAMRLYPPGWTIGRRALVDVTIGEFVIPKGALVLMSQHVMHRRADFYPEPEKFDLARWTPEAKAERPQFSYFPFGGGPRGCVGEPFAWMEGVLVLATLARHWKLRLVPGHQVVPQPLVTLRPRHGVLVTAEPRSLAPHGGGG
ncbi:MAG: cytochrome [Cyanobacteria bacterium RYN_339]|nr:cytochrome [Cyanobacteria bacterium RYN_339]